MISEIKHLILDMDGVLWRGETPMPGLQAFFITLDRLGINFMLATNNATKTAAQYSEKLTGFGLDIPPQQILSSAEATASYLREQYDGGTLIYVVGEKGLHQALQAKGFRILTPDRVAAGETAPLVVMGFNRHVTYIDLAMASLLVHKGATFVGTNPDPSFPSELGPLPGAGSLQAVITSATGVRPTIVGKPGPIIFQEAMHRLGGSEQDTAMVGDRLSTDIAGGLAAGIRTILVLSGISSRDDVAASSIKPEFILEDIADLARQLEASREGVQ